MNTYINKNKSKWVLRTSKISTQLINFAQPPFTGFKIHTSPLHPLDPAKMHEVRTILDNINLAVAILRSMETKEQLKVYYEVIERSTNRINELLEE